MRTMFRVILFSGLMLLYCGTLKAQTSDMAVQTIEHESGEKEIQAVYTYYYDSNENYDSANNLDEDLGEFLGQIMGEILDNHGVTSMATVSSNGGTEGYSNIECEHSLTFTFSIAERTTHQNDNSHMVIGIRIEVEDKKNEIK